MCADKKIQLKATRLGWYGRLVGYSNQTEFLIQVGKGPKGSYKTRYSITGDLHRAIYYYSAINIGYGFKKRLFMTDSTKPVLLRETS